VYCLYALREGAKLASRRQTRQLVIDVNVSTNDSRNMCILNSHGIYLIHDASVPSLGAEPAARGKNRYVGVPHTRNSGHSKESTLRCCEVDALTMETVKTTVCHYVVW
jgi:hypothetical protein